MSTTTAYEYDLNGNVTQKSLANGTVETRVYDARNRVSSITNKSGAVTRSSYVYSYDGVGNVTQVVESYVSGGPAGRTIVNTYDQSNRLTSEQITTGTTVVTTGYTYDKGHNRTAKVVTGGSNPGTTGYVIGTGSNGAGANQIVSATLPDSTVVGFSYDANGNRTGKTIGANTDSYSYDNENRLVTLNKETGSGTGYYTYGYDYRTRRVTRNEPGGTTQVAFNGGTSIIESGASNAEFVRGPGQGGGVGGLEYSVRGGDASFNQYNSRGDVVGQTDGSAVQTYQAAYEAFGTHPDETGSTSDRQHANTKEEDPTGLLNEGFRYRDLETGTFITRDPLGFAAGPNPYIYCRQNPWTYFDPRGLEDNGSSKTMIGDASVHIKASAGRHSVEIPITLIVGTSDNIVRVPETLVLTYVDDNGDIAFTPNTGLTMKGESSNEPTTEVALTIVSAKLSITIKVITTSHTTHNHHSQLIIDYSVIWSSEFGLGLKAKVKNIELPVNLHKKDSAEEATGRIIVGEYPDEQ